MEEQLPSQTPKPLQCSSIPHKDRWQNVQVASTRVPQLIIISDFPSYHNLAQASRVYQFREPEKVLETPRSRLRRRGRRPHLRQLSACLGDQCLWLGPTEEISTAVLVHTQRSSRPHQPRWILRQTILLYLHRRLHKIHGDIHWLEEKRLAIMPQNLPQLLPHKVETGPSYRKASIRLRLGTSEPRSWKIASKGRNRIRTFSAILPRTKRCLRTCRNDHHGYDKGNNSWREHWWRIMARDCTRHDLHKK